MKVLQVLLLSVFAATLLPTAALKAQPPAPETRISALKEIWAAIAAKNVAKFNRRIDKNAWFEIYHSERKPLALGSYRALRNDCRFNGEPTTENVEGTGKYIWHASVRLACGGQYLPVTDLYFYFDEKGMVIGSSVVSVVPGP